MRKLIVLLIIILPFAVVAQTITTVVGTGINGLSGDGLPATIARVSSPDFGVFDRFGNFYYSEQLSHKIRKIDTFGIITTYAGTGLPGFSGDGGPATIATFRFPQGVACDSNGNLYVADHQNYRIRKIDRLTGFITTFAGDGSGGDFGDGTPATSAGFFPSDIHFDNRANLYVSDALHNKIRKINDLGIISTIAGVGVSGFWGDGGLATSALLWQPTSLAVDSKGNLFFSDDMNKRIRKVDTFGIITTIAGNGIGLYGGDGIPATAAAMGPYSIAIDKIDQIYLSDTNDRIRSIDTFGIINTVVGNGVYGYNGDGIPATSAWINRPAGIFFDACNKMYFMDGYNYRIRRVDFPTVLSVPTIELSVVSTAPIGSVVTISATLHNVGSSFVIHWQNHGIEFNTTTMPVVSYVKGAGVDSITARVVPAGYGCWDSTTSAGHIVTAVIEEVFQANFNDVGIYPNPVISTVNIFAESEMKKITISSLLGEVLLTKVCNSKNSKIDISFLPAGLYVVRIIDANNEQAICKLIKL